MGVQLNIKSAEAHALAIEVAELTHESITQAVINALKAQKLALTRDERLARIRALSVKSGKAWGEQWGARDPGDVLHDEMGLPE